MTIFLWIELTALKFTLLLKFVVDLLWTLQIEMLSWFAFVQKFVDGLNCSKLVFVF